jgi:hypothetical protein
MPGMSSSGSTSRYAADKAETMTPLGHGNLAFRIKGLAASGHGVGDGKSKAARGDERVVGHDRDAVRVGWARGFRPHA